MNRLNLHTELTELRNTKAYYQPPGSTKIVYPCFVYNLQSMDVKRADNKVRIMTPCYDVIYISKSVDDSICEEVLSKFKMASFISYYVADNLHHYKFKIFY